MRVVLAFALLLLAAGSVQTALATNTVKINSKIKIFNRAPIFHGRVKSEKHACVEQRRVSLFRKKQNGTRKLIGSTRTDRSGDWTVPFNLTQGKYFAVAKKRREGTAGTIFVCRRAKSKTQNID